MAYTQSHDSGSSFMNYMNATAFLDECRANQSPSFGLIPHSSEHITERIQTRVIIVVVDAKTPMNTEVPCAQLTPVNYSDGIGHVPEWAYWAMGALYGGLSTVSWSGALSGAGRGFMVGSITDAIGGAIRGAVTYANTTPLFRSVDNAEYGDIQNFGGFRSVGGAEGKYFWTSQNSATMFGDVYGQTNMVGIRVAKGFVSSMAWSNLDSIGAAVCFDDLSYLSSIAYGLWYH